MASRSGLLLGLAVLLLLLLLASTAWVVFTTDASELIRIQRRVAWFRLPELARQHWGLLSPPDRDRWLRLGAAAWEAGDRLASPGSTFETVAVQLAFDAFRAGGAAPGGVALGFDAEAFGAIYEALAAAAGPLAPGPPAPPGPAALPPLQHTDDPQNSHDSLLLAGLSGVLAQLRAEQAALPLPPLGSIAAELPAAMAADGGEGEGGEGEGGEGGRPPSPPEPGALALAAAALGGLEPSTQVDGLLGASDAECLQRLWLRAEAPPNSGAARLRLRRAAFDALLSCWEDGALVCAGGRAARFLSAFAGVDADPALWAGCRLEDLRNEVFAAAGALIRELAGAAAASADEGRRLAGLAYLASSGAEAAALPPAPPEAAEALSAELSAAVGALVDSRCAAFSGGFGRAPELCARLRRQALAAI